MVVVVVMVVWLRAYIAGKAGRRMGLGIWGRGLLLLGVEGCAASFLSWLFVVLIVNCIFFHGSFWSLLLLGTRARSTDRLGVGSTLMMICFCLFVAWPHSARVRPVRVVYCGQVCTGLWCCVWCLCFFPFFCVWVLLNFRLARATIVTRWRTMKGRLGR